MVVPVNRHTVDLIDLLVAETVDDPAERDAMAEQIRRLLAEPKTAMPVYIPHTDIVRDRPCGTYCGRNNKGQTDD